ncbi:DegT/DnrJ/EryC1/StrS family aminotransferase [Verrucomicrobiota bacterium]
MSEKTIPWWLTTLGDDETDALREAVQNRCINRGRLCERLEQRLGAAMDGAHVVLTTSGSASLLLALMSCGIGPGDEVVVPAFGFIAPAHAALLPGASVRLVDVLPDRPLIDPELVGPALTERTKAVIAVHLNGCSIDMRALRALTAPRGIALIEDCAQAFQSRNAVGLLGTQSDAGAFSFGITKLITTAEGGFVATRDETRYRKLRRLQNHGTERIADNVFGEPGFNLRLTDLQAAVGLVQLDKLQRKIDAVQRVHVFYRDALAGIPCLKLLEADIAGGQIPLWTQALCTERDLVVEGLAERGIQAAPFHPCLADSPHLRQQGEFPNSRFFACHGLTLPSGTDQPEENLARTADALREVCAGLPEWNCRKFHEEL